MENIDTDKYFGFIYETTNLINNKKYIGKCIFSRKNNWKAYLGSGIYFKRAVDKYGKENFKREIIFLALDEEELNELEEAVIDIVDAVVSNKYYNIKKTSIGGDVFTNNPRKEEIREMRREQMSGKGNHQYGKPKTQKMIDSVKKANSKRVSVDGVTYSSISECSKQLGIGFSTVQYRLNNSRQENYKYIED